MAKFYTELQKVGQIFKFLNFQKVAEFCLHFLKEWLPLNTTNGVTKRVGKNGFVGLGFIPLGFYKLMND